MQQREKSGDTTLTKSFGESTSKYRKGISLVSDLLNDYFGVDLISGGTGSWALEPDIPPYCVIEIPNGKILKKKV